MRGAKQIERRTHNPHWQIENMLRKKREEIQAFTWLLEEQETSPQ